jgi:tRNA-binding protein
VAKLKKRQNRTKSGAFLLPLEEILIGFDIYARGLIDLTEYFQQSFQSYKIISSMQTIDFIDFQRIDIRIGTIIRTENFEKARKPAYKLWVDLGDLGVKKSSAQITDLYSAETLIGKQVICVCNFAPRQIADFMSEVLVTGFDNGNGQVILATSERIAPNGSKLH